jgi:hypothetical protein
MPEHRSAARLQTPAAATSPARRKPAAPATHMSARSPVVTGLFTAATLALCAYGFIQRDEASIIAKHGVGYWLGIAGSVMMLSLLLYPLRKSYVRWPGSLTTWFKVHMILGVIGPVLILFHSNFRLSDVNSSVAMIGMLLVVASGVLGRYLYAKLSMGLYGNKASALALLHDAHVFEESFGDGLEDAALIQAELAAFTQEVLPEPGSLITSIGQAWMVERQSKARHFRLMVAGEAIIAAQALRELWSNDEYERRVQLAELQLDAYFACLKKATQLRVYERAFSFWHLLHMPLFFMLILVVLAHVFAVHWY